MFENYKDVVTVKDLTAMLGIGRNTAYELVRAGIIRSVRVGRQVRISKQTVIDYFNAQNIPNMEETKDLNPCHASCMIKLPNNLRGTERRT